MLSIEEGRAKWIGLFADQQSSGLTVTAWCRERGIEKNTFYGWRKHQAKTGAKNGRFPTMMQGLHHE
jgi:transposase-like protein